MHSCKLVGTTGLAGSFQDTKNPSEKSDGEIQKNHFF